MRLRRKIRLALPLGVILYETVLRPWQEHWGTRDSEVIEEMRSDHLLREPAHQVTRAVTIDAPPEQVWPWIAQMGADRGGFYSHDWLENRFGLDIHSSNDIHPEWQDLSVGDVVYANRNRTGGWYVVELVPGELVALALADLLRGRPVRRTEAMRWEFLWTFSVRADDGGKTRLVIRERVAFGSRLSQWLMAPMGLVSFVMTRKMMLGIKDRAEALTSSGRLESEAPAGRAGGKVA